MDKEIIKQHGITPQEYQHILHILGRDPNMVELGIFSVMWSEHCSYKSSRIFLKKLPTKGPQVICGPGENAGVVDIGDGLAIIFKMESHNHPSFIEPFQGAATGVGGILRDIFTMGARPVALLNSLRFGAPSHPKTKRLIHGVVAGIAGYGNCMGIPTVGGEVTFDASYNGNNLVNAMCVGLVETKKIFMAKAAGLGNPVFYVGSKTGKDGIHGATMASDVFDEKSEEKRPTVQVGDPFTEKRVMEACLELFQTKDLIGIQDMGAAGLTCSTFEMASKGDVGIDLDLSKVPLREAGMTPYEVMLSESQERMLFVAKKGAEKRVEKIFKKWDLDVAAVGKVVKGCKVRVFNDGDLVAEIPAHPIAEEAPIYERPRKKPAYLAEAQNLNPAWIKKDENLNEVLLRLTGSPAMASKHWVYRQYDHMVGTDTIVLPGSDAAVVRIKGTKKAIAMTTDCNGRFVYLDPFRGGVIAVAEAARNIVCSGAKPLAVTDCLNFGSPENPEVLWQFEQALLGISEACVKLKTPIVSGNVSFYNESQAGGNIPTAILPTPTIGMIGLLEDVSCHCTQWFKEEGDLVVLVAGDHKIGLEDLGGSEYLFQIHGRTQGRTPHLDLAKEVKVQAAVLAGINKGWIKSAHDCSEGGLALCLAESAMTGPKHLGATIQLKNDGLIPLFAEKQSRIVVTLAQKNLKKFLALAKAKGAVALSIGTVGGDELKINQGVSVAVERLYKEWHEGFEKCVA